MTAVHLVARKAITSAETANGTEHLVLEPFPALEVRLVRPQAGQELADEGADRAVSFGGLHPGPPINFFGHRDRDVLHDVPYITASRAACALRPPRSRV